MTTPARCEPIGPKVQATEYRRLKHTARTFVVPLALATVLLLARSVQASPWLDFTQFEASSSSSTLVLVRALPVADADRPAPLLSATATRWTDGQAVALGVTQRRTLASGGGHAARLGLGVGVDHFRSRAEDVETRRTGASLRAQAEVDGPLWGGPQAARYYLLAQGNSFRGGWFVTGQVSFPNAGAGLELSRYGDQSYHATTATIRLPLGAPGWSLRLGAVRDSNGQRAVIGVGWNGF
jgi:hypothetical protein